MYFPMTLFRKWTIAELLVVGGLMAHNPGLAYGFNYSRFF